jgi:hypothetical protein
MLLELLQHHEDIFHAILRPLISAKNCRGLIALAGICKYFREVIMKLDIIKHYCAFRRCALSIKNIGYISFNDLTFIGKDDNLIIWKTLATNNYKYIAPESIYNVIRIQHGSISNHLIIYNGGGEPSYYISIECFVRVLETSKYIQDIPKWIYKYKSKHLNIGINYIHIKC